MKNEEIVKALRATESRSKRELLDAAADLIERLTARCALRRGDRRGAGAAEMDPCDGAPAGIAELGRINSGARMTDMERKTFCAALSRYGAQAQITMAFEEMAELQDVLCKFLRGRVDGDTFANIAEEIADVGIMLDQMAIEFEVEDAVAEQRAHKVQRLRSRLEYVEQEG